MEDPIRVLYVDDEPGLLKICKLFLERTAGFTVDTLTSAADALAKIPVKQYDAIVSDYQMPEMDGIAFLKAVRASGNAIPFILFTGRGREEIVIQALNEGADFYLQKGGEPASQFIELAHKIRRAVDRRRAVDELSAANERLAASEEELLSQFDELKNYQETIRHREHFFRNVFTSIQDGISILDEKMTILDVNKTMEQWYSHEMPLIGRKCYEAYHGRAERCQVCPSATTLKTGKPAIETVPLIDEGIIKGWLDLYSFPFIDADTGRMKGVIEYVHNISDRRQKEDELRAAYEQLAASDEELRSQYNLLAESERILRESEEKFRTLFNNANDGIYIHEMLPGDRPGKFLEVNSIICSRLGYNREELLTMKISDIVSDTHKYKMKEIGQQIAKKRFHTFYAEHKRKDGSVFPVEVNSHKFAFSGKEIVLAVARDISERKRAEDALNESEEKYRLLLQNANDAVFIHELTGEGPGIFLEVNDKACHMLGYSREELLRMGPNDIDAVEQHKNIPDIVNQLLTRGSVQFETVHVTKDGHRIPVEISINLVSLRGKKMQISIVRDVTERKRAEYVLKQANHKLKLLGSITRHDISNQLTVLQGYLEILKDSQTDPTLNTYFQKVVISAERISAMIQLTKEYESVGVHAPAWQDIHKLADAAIKQASFGPIVVKNELPDGEQVFADPLITRVFSNLVDNAARHGGRITTIRFFLKGGNSDHILTCEDDGVGIPAEEKELIFAHGYGKNTGLGLSLSREILDITGITIRENGEPGKGARFEIMVPKEAWRCRHDH